MTKTHSSELQGQASGTVTVLKLRHMRILQEGNTKFQNKEVLNQLAKC